MATDPETNGGDPVAGDQAQLPPGAVVITITLTPTPRGYQMRASATPADVFPDTIIDGCNRAVRYFSRKQQAAETLMAFAQAQQNAEVARATRGLMGPGGRPLS